MVLGVVDDWKASWKSWCSSLCLSGAWYVPGVLVRMACVSSAPSLLSAPRQLAASGPVPGPQLPPAKPGRGRSAQGCGASAPLAWCCRKARGSSFTEQVLGAGPGAGQADAGPTCAREEAHCFSTRLQGRRLDAYCSWPSAVGTPCPCPRPAAALE